MESIQEKAEKWAQQKYKNEPSKNKAAFARSVNFLYSGLREKKPSVREQALYFALENIKLVNLPTIDNIFPDKKIPSIGEWDFEQACLFAASICFGAIAGHHFVAWRTQKCYNDSKKDLRELKNFRVILTCY